MNSWEITASASTFHPNKYPFTGVLTFLDSPSDKAPSGSRGHLVILTSSAAHSALNSLIGMAVSYKEGWDGHNKHNKIGIITAAEIRGKELGISGFIYAKDYSHIMPYLSNPKEPLGFSYELDSAHVNDMHQKIWTLDKATFTGAAILYRSKAAYKNTSFQLVEREVAA